jgi:hypothetical protein
MLCSDYEHYVTRHHFSQVFDAIVQLVEEGQDKKNSTKEELRISRHWVSIDNVGINFMGRFVPDTEYDPSIFQSALSAEAKVNFEAWLRETTTLAVNTEINVQLGFVLVVHDFY